ncbi:filamentous hemagglutinin N-terminal domain-containing protein [Paucibacter sp. TC2R-5]|uniref:MBG domain-containing protein n=1 Tax=Paucibacter sp. TC2R-5 TaxID=2893555 RepID=UPI0021E4156A|nr:MBG domain-containing protein [Paucibacter sp. TC2R-5]MCV2357578.1 filamentous hemagglutinin N-terminal domain-containing protein [Paucibacter sp. TC2R-5]
MSFLSAQAARAAQLPTGAQVVAGQAQISAQGNVLTVQQNSALLATDWRSFSIGAGHTVNFVQPSSTSVALNRVVGNEVSRIQGALNANGQVFLLNPNGVLFTPTAQVNVGALVASTLRLDNQDFLAGRYRFSGDSGNAIINQGQITAASGGAVALIAAKISNSGSIFAPAGQVLMGAGSKVVLDLGGPVKLKVDAAAIDALIEQGGAIKADGGLVYLSAKAAGSLASTVINHTGVTEAQTLASGEKGEIFLMGGMGNDRIVVGGRLDASGPQGGGGGFVETSAALVDFHPGRVVTTLSADGRNGTWLIDPNDYTIAASGGNISGSQLGTDLASSNVTISTATQGTTGGNGDIHVNDAVTWAANKLTLTAERNINVNSDLNATGTGSLAFVYGQASSNGSGAGYSVANGVKVLIPNAAAFTWKKGSTGATKNLVLDNGLLRFGNGTQDSIDPSGQLRQPFYFDNVTTGRNGWYKMTISSNPLDLAVGVGGDGSNSWNYNGTVKTTQDTFTAALSNKSVNIAGYHEGVGTIISSATLNMGGGQLIRVQNSFELLAGNSYSKTDTQLTNLGSSALSNLRLWIGTRDDWVGQGDASYKSKGNIVNNTFVSLPTQNTASNALKVTENNDGSTGGAVLFYSTSDGVDMAHASCCSFSNSTNKDPRTSQINSAQVDGSYAMFKRLSDLASGQSGGFVWYYAGAPVSLINNAISSVGQAAGGGSTPIYLRLNPGSSIYGARPSFSYSLFDAISGGNLISDASASGTAVWTGAPSSTSNAGTYSLSYASGVSLGNTAYSLSAGAAANWSITPRTLNLSVSKTYDGNNSMVSGFALTGMVNGDASPTVTGTAAVASKNVGAYSAFVSSSLALSNSNYSLSGGTVSASIAAKPLTASYTASNKVYDGSASAVVVASSADLIANDMLSIAHSNANFVNSSAGNAKTVTIGGISLSGADAANYSLQNTSASASANISPRPITVTADTKSKVYGNADPALSYAVTAGNLVGDDSLVGALSRSPGSNVGNYAIDASGLANGNYLITAQNGVLSIAPRPITVTADAKTKIYGNADPALSYAVTAGNLLGDDSLAGALSRSPGSSVGNYTIDASSLVNGNYLITTQNGVLSITPRPITVTADAKSKVYGNAEPTLSYAVTAGNLVGDDSLVGALSRSPGGIVGNYTIDASSLANGNYLITAQNGVLSITPRPITVAADAKSKTYGEADPALSYQISSGSMVSGDKLDGALSRASGESIGSHAISAQALSNSNYAITAVDSNLVIAPAVNANVIAGNSPSATNVISMPPALTVPNFGGGAFTLIDVPAAPAANAGGDSSGPTARSAGTTPPIADNSALTGSAGSLRMLVVGGGIKLPELRTTPANNQEGGKEQ